MQAVPSLVGTGTAVAAAATGLVFAQPDSESKTQQPPATAPSDRPSHIDNPYSHGRPSTMSHTAATSLGYDSASGRAAADCGSSSSLAASSSYSHQALSFPHAPYATPSAATLPRGAAHYPPLSSRNRRHSIAHKSEVAPPPGSEASRDSVSSNGSWIRRLSARPLSQHGSLRSRPLSQHGSLRSSIGPDSLNFSLGSANPILPSSSPTPPVQQPSTRNKLVKRATATLDGNTTLSRRGSRSQMPTLRRPATSHQRSATLRQAPPELEYEVASSGSASARPRFSFDQKTRPSLAIFRAGAETPDSADFLEQDERSEAWGRSQETATRTRWTSFFHRRVSRTSLPFRGSSPLSDRSYSGTSSQPNSLPARTIQAQPQVRSPPCLTHASVVTLPELGSNRRFPSRSPSVSPVDNSMGTTTKGAGSAPVPSHHGSSSSPEDTPSKRARRSISLHFGSPTNWVSRASSLRRPKRDSNVQTSSAANATVSSRPGSRSAFTNTQGNTKRHVSAPLSTTNSALSQLQGQAQPRSVTAPATMRRRDDLSRQPAPTELEQIQRGAVSRSSPDFPTAHATPRMVLKRQQRNASTSPLPALSRFPSYNADGSRPGASASVFVGPPTSQKENQAPRAFPLVSQTRGVSNESVPSDFDLRGFISSGDDDDTDFKSDTAFDSLRTTASTRARPTDTPIESVFDESPPSTASNSKTKRLSIQEILGHAWDSDTRIMEEDEGFTTPIRSAVSAQPLRSSSPNSIVGHYRDADFFDTPAQRSRNMAGGDSEANSVVASTETDTDAGAGAGFPFSTRAEFGEALSVDDGDDDSDWGGMDENGVANYLSPPSRSSFYGLGTDNLLLQVDHSGDQGHSNSYHRSALAMISGNGGSDVAPLQDESALGNRDQSRGTLFDWSESTVHPDKTDAEGHSPRPKTVHGKQELDLRNGRQANRKGPVVAHVRSQSVPVISDPTEGPKPSTSKFGTWASGPKNASEDWDDDFDFGTSSGGDAGSDALDGFDFGENADGQPSTVRSGKDSAASFAMVVPASIQATQPTVKAHSGQIRELSLLVNDLKRLCRYARDLNIIDEAPALWTEAKNIIALASPEEEEPAAAASVAHAITTTESSGSSRRTSADFDSDSIDNRFLDEGFDADVLDRVDDPFHRTEEFKEPHAPATPPPPPAMSRTAVVRERKNERRRSVFSPEDDIFGGNWPLANEKVSAGNEDDEKHPLRPQTPERVTTHSETPDSAMIESIMEAMQQQRSASVPLKSPVKHAPNTELFFNTNTLQELVKRANSVFHMLSDLVRRAELITQSPVVTPRHDRLNRLEDGSPAFTRVFTDPSSPSRRLPQSHSNNSILSRASPSLESSNANSISQRLQMMTVG